jgi:hypothetical protein
MKRLLAVAALILGTAGGLIAASAPANALATHAATGATHTVVMAHWPSCPSATVCTYNLSANNTAGFGCSARTWTRPYLTEPMGYITNNCSVRVWLHQYQDGSGWATCIAPYEAAGLPSGYRYPGNLQVSTNHSTCYMG